MNLKLTGLVTLFGLAGCSLSETVVRDCSGPAGEAKMVREDRFQNVFTLIHTKPDGSTKKYGIDQTSPFQEGEILLGENAVYTICAQGKPDQRWSLKR